MTDQSNNTGQSNSAPQGVEQNTQQQAAPSKPSHIAYQVRENGDKAYFNNIGAAFEHKDGKGYNINLDAVPVDGKVTLRTFEERLQKVQNGSDRNSRGQDQGHEQ